MVIWATKERVWGSIVNLTYRRIASDEINEVKMRTLPAFIQGAVRDFEKMDKFPNLSVRPVQDRMNSHEIRPAFRSS